MKKKIAVLMAAVCVLSTPLTGCTIGDTQIVLDVNQVRKDYLFSINGTDVTKEEAKLYLCNYQNIYGHEYGVNLWEHDFGAVVSEESLEAYVKDVTLTELANIMCMNLLAKEQGVELTEAELQKAKSAAFEYYNSLTKDEIAYMGIDKSKMESYYEKYATAQKLFDTLTQGVNEEVSDDEARVMCIQQIYVTNQDDAQVVKTKLDAGDDFATVASNYNEASSIETYIRRDEFPMEVEKIAYNLDNNEQSDLIATAEGYYFIKCLNKYEEAMTEENKISIIAKRRKEQFEDVFQGFVEAAEFDLNETVWEEIVLDTSGSITTSSFFEIYDKYFTE